MTALDDRPLTAAPEQELQCLWPARPGHPVCGSTRGLRRLFIGWRCPEHTLPGAQVYETATTHIDTLTPVLTAVPDLPAPALPDPGRPGAAVQAEPTGSAAQAAALAWGRSGKPRRRLLERFIAVGDDGMTSWEAWTWYRATHGDIDLYSLRPRLTELKRDGWLHDSGRVRHPRGHGDHTAPAEEVLVLTPRGRSEAAAASTGGSR